MSPTASRRRLKAMRAVARGVAGALVALGLLLSVGGCVRSAATAGGAGAATSSAPVELNVSAASSLKGVLTASAAAFERANNARLVFDFGASGQLVKQIEGGAPADVLLSASPAAVTTLAVEGLASAESSATFAGNALVILVPKGDPARIHGPGDLARAGRLATGDPTVAPQGQKAVEWLTGMGMWGSLRPKFVFAANAAQTDDYVARGEVDAGIGFASDAHGRTDIEVAYAVPDGRIRPIGYVAVPLTGTRQGALAKAYIGFLLSGPTQAAFVDAGFTPAPGR